MQSKFVISTSERGYIYRLITDNGVVIQTSQIHSQSSPCIEEIEMVMDSAARACVEDQTEEAYVVKKSPKFEIFTDRHHYFHYRLRAENGEIIGFSRGFFFKSSCQKGLSFVQNTARDAVIENEPYTCVDLI